MRLLQTNYNDTTFSLIEYLDPDDIPPYAILSHTWAANDEEVNFQDVTLGTGSNKQGWRKITFCADQAKRDGLSYFWVDSCCIDKRSSQELSEAIISMFRWYKQAEKCYVYLADVGDEPSVEPQMNQAFRTSRWWQRGWTLQELIAPAIVEFYSRNQTLLGTKESLLLTIHEITKIPTRALCGAPLSSFSLGVRMSWVSKRGTTRPEDAAYCLMGILGVSMATLYGEGQDAAFARLKKCMLLDKTEKQKVMESLYFDQIDARYMTIKTAHSKTCSWLIRSQIFTSWLETTSQSFLHGFLWIKGKPGTGKSTLMKFALSHVRSTMKDAITIGYFFNARGEVLEKSTLGVYRSLLFQLLEQLPALEEVFGMLFLSRSSLRIRRGWTVEMLESLLEQVVLNLGSTSVVCFIDALDECEEQQIRDMISFFERVGEIVASNRIRFRVCLSSRHYPNITIRFGSKLILDDEEGHTQDIAHYLKTKFDIGDSELADSLRHEIQAKASGVFMWVILVVNILRREFDLGRGQMHALERRLKDIPPDLNSLFHDILTRDSRNKEELIMCIRWVLLAREPLSPAQLYGAILSGVEHDALKPYVADPMNEDAIRLFILDASKGLTEVTKSSEPKVQFIHESVRDFLLKDDGLGAIWPEFRDNFIGHSHDRLKQCCYDYMSLDVVNRTRMQLKAEGPISQPLDLRSRITDSFPFFVYAVQNVLYHADAAQGYSIPQGEFVEMFQSEQWLRWLKLRNLFEGHGSRGHSEVVSFLYVLAHRNLSHLIRAHPSPQLCFEIEKSKVERYGSPILAAIATHSANAVVSFVESVHQFAGQCQSLASCLKFYHNARQENWLDADFNLLDSKTYRSLYHRGFVQDLIGAFLVDLDNSWLVRLAVMTKDLDLQKSHGTNESLLLAAVKSSSPNIVRWLGSLDTTNLKSLDGNGEGLRIQAVAGDSDLAPTLPRPRCLDVNARDNQGLTLLMLALRNKVASRSVECVQLLLDDPHINVNMRNSAGKTALMLSFDHLSIDNTERILKHPSLDINAQDKNGNTALMLAIDPGSSRIVRLILQHNSLDLNAKNNRGRTALMKAVCADAQDAIELLLNAEGLDKTVRDQRGKTAGDLSNEIVQRTDPSSALYSLRRNMQARVLGCRLIYGLKLPVDVRFLSMEYAL